MSPVASAHCLQNIIAVLVTTDPCFYNNPLDPTRANTDNILQL
jgi:hypothetical protein